MKRLRSTHRGQHAVDQAPFCNTNGLLPEIQWKVENRNNYFTVQRRTEINKNATATLRLHKMDGDLSKNYES